MIFFLAAPFTMKLQETPTGKSLDQSFSSVIARTIMLLRSYGHEVFSSHEREHWGKRIFPPSDAIKADFEGIESSDAVIAFIGDPPSPGVQMELGFSIAKRKKIYVFYTQDFDLLPHLTKGMNIFRVPVFQKISSIETLPKEVQELVLDKLKL